MPRYIVKLEGGVKGARKGGPWYMEWSTIVDAPVSPGLPLEDFKQYYREQYGEQGMRELEGRLERVEAQGTSSHMGGTAFERVRRNRAGDKERSLRYREIVRHYCQDEY